MIFLKSVMFGIAAAFAASVVWILGRLVFPLNASLYFESAPGWSVSGTVAVALIGFIVGFCWGMRKFRLLH